MRLDILIRLIPLAVAPLVFSWFTGTPLASFGLSLRHPLRDVLISVPLGLAGFGIAAAFANYLARRSGRWFVPTAPDLAPQSVYYLQHNAPIDEWFVRCFLQDPLSRSLHEPPLAVHGQTQLHGDDH